MRPLKFRVRYANTWCVIELEKGITEYGHSAYMDCVQRGERFYQFTGLLDKNGKEIYEGDILSFVSVESKFFNEPYKPWEVTWKDDEARFSDWSPRGSAQVIGNIIENPELLK